MIEKIQDGGDELKKYKLTLYSNDIMRDEVLSLKKNELYYIWYNGIRVGYIQMTESDNYMLIHEIEIFSPYRYHGYGSMVIEYLRDKHEIIPIDIQEDAIGFWFKYLGREYWKKLIFEYGDVNSLAARLSYSDIIKRHIMLCIT